MSASNTQPQQIKGGDGDQKKGSKTQVITRLRPSVPKAWRIKQ